VALPEPVKRTALQMGPRDEIASLTGDAWLRFLDGSYGGTGFTEGAGRLLPVLAYGLPSDISVISAEQAEELTALVRRWIRRHSIASAKDYR
jgi:hypothetical protein